MTYAVTVVVGLGLLLGSGAVAEETWEPGDALAQIDLAPSQLPETEVAAGSSIAPLGTPTSRAPLLVLMDGNAPGNAPVSASLAQAEGPEAGVGTSALAAFGPEGVRLPAYEPEIVTGSVSLAPRR